MVIILVLYLMYYNGQYENDEYDKFKFGKVTYYYQSYGKYIYNIYYDELRGIGKYYYNNDEFWYGDSHNKGKYYFNDGDNKDGIFHYNKYIEGKIKITYSNGNYEGGWEYGCENGYGVERINGITFKRNYRNGKSHGKFKKI